MYDLDRIRNTVSMRDALSHYGIAVDRAGFAACPFHHDRHPSMKIYPGDRGYFCFVCHEGGDALRFIQKMEGGTFGEAVKVAAGIAGIEEGMSPADRRAQADRAKLRRIHEQRCTELHAQWIKAVDRARFLTSLAECFTDWTETLCSILTEREDMLRLADRIDERLAEYERAGITPKPDGV